MTIEEKDLWHGYCRVIHIYLKAWRRWFASLLYCLLSKCSHSISAFYMVIVRSTMGEGKIKDLVFRHAGMKALRWGRRTIKAQCRCRDSLDECVELLHMSNEILAYLKEYFQTQK